MASGWQGQTYAPPLEGLGWVSRPRVRREFSADGRRAIGGTQSGRLGVESSRYHGAIRPGRTSEERFSRGSTGSGSEDRESLQSGAGGATAA